MPHGSRSCFRNHALIISRLYVLQRAEKVPFRVLHARGIWFLVRLQIRVDEFDQTVEVFGRHLRITCQLAMEISCRMKQHTVSFC